MWSNGFQRGIDLVARDGLAAVLPVILSATAAAAGSWLFLVDILPRLLALLVLLWLGILVARRVAGPAARRRVVRALGGQDSRWDLWTADGQSTAGRLVHAWEVGRAGNGLLGLGWVSPDGYRYLLAWTRTLPADACRRLRVHRHLAAAAGESGTQVTLRRVHGGRASPMVRPDSRP